MGQGERGVDLCGGRVAPGYISDPQHEVTQRLVQQARTEAPCS